MLGQKNKKAYTIGYQGRTLGQVAKFLNEYDAILIDIRFSPRSMNPAWSGSNLSQTLGSQYRHLKAFGNRNYKGGPVELVLPMQGLGVLEQLTKTPILMCVCKDPLTCHRNYVAIFLRKNGWDVEEIGLPPGAQFSLTM